MPPVGQVLTLCGEVAASKVIRRVNGVSIKHSSSAQAHITCLQVFFTFFFFKVWHAESCTITAELLLHPALHSCTLLMQAACVRDHAHLRS